MFAHSYLRNNLLYVVFLKKLSQMVRLCKRENNRKAVEFVASSGTQEKETLSAYISQHYHLNGVYGIVLRNSIDDPCNISYSIQSRKLSVGGMD
jgi:hypothetical protein